MKPSQLLDFLAHTIPYRLPILIKGAPGVGKTDIVSQACAATGTQLFVSHPVVSDPTDYKGMPCIVNGKARFLPFGDLECLIDCDHPSVFFLDDLGQSPPSVQASCMHLILNRKINSHTVSPYVTFIAATNRRADKAGVTGILEPVKSRFVSIIELDPDLVDWITWANKNNISPILIAFLRFRPSLLFSFTPSSDITNSPCPRTVANVSKLLQLELNPAIEYETIAGAAGDVFAIEFTAFLQIYRTLPNVDLIFSSPDLVPIPSDPATLYALCGALAHKVTYANFPNLVKYSLCMPKEFEVLLMLNCKSRCPDLVNTTAFIEWAIKNKF